LIIKLNRLPWSEVFDEVEAARFIQSELDKKGIEYELIEILVIFHYEFEYMKKIGLVKE
jgi:hypothetical protein